jgi:hypothetical protein
MKPGEAERAAFEIIVADMYCSLGEEDLDLLWDLIDEHFPTLTGESRWIIVWLARWATRGLRKYADEKQGDPRGLYREIGRRLAVERLRGDRDLGDE